MSQPSPAEVLLHGEKTEETDYEALLLGLAQSQNPEEELTAALRQKPSDKTQWKNPLIPEKPAAKENRDDIEILSVETIFRIARIVQGTLQSELNARMEKLSEKSTLSEEPQQNRRALQAKTSAASLVCSLTGRSDTSEPIQNWEATSRAMALTDIKTRTIVRSAMACESIFEHSNATPKTQEKMSEALKVFREASRTFEISLAAKNNTQVGPGKAAAQVKRIPPKALELIACLTQITLESMRENAPALPAQDEKTLRAFQAQCRRAFGLAYAAGDSGSGVQQQSMEAYETLLSTSLEEKCPSLPNVKKLWGDWKTREEEPISERVAKITEALYLEAGVGKAAQAALESAKKRAIGGNFEAEEPSEKEWITIRELEKTHAKFEKLLSESLPKKAEGKSEEDFKKDQADALAALPVTLRVFAALKRETAGLGKASQMVLLGKIVGSKSNQKTFEKGEKENPDNALEPFGFIHETKILQQEAGRTLANSGFGPQDQNQLEELCDLATNLDYVESILYSTAVQKTLHNEQRQEAEASARRVVAKETTQEGLDPQIQKIYDRVEKTLESLERTLQEQGQNLEALPKMLRDHEASETLNMAITRLIKATQLNQEGLHALATDESLKKPVRNAAQSLLDIALKTQGEDGINPQELSDISKKVTTNSIATKESLGRIIANLAEGRGTNGEIAEIDEVAKVVTLQTLGDKQEQTISEEEAKRIVEAELSRSGRENESPFTKIKTAKLAEIAKITNKPEAIRALRLRYQNQFLRDIRTIRRWREKTEGMDKEDNRILAVALCKVPKAIQEACKDQILRNLESCTQPPVWNDHASIAKEDVDASYGQLNQSYALLRNAFRKEKEPQAAERDLIGNLQRLHALTEEIHNKSSARMVRSELLAEALASKDQELRACQLQAMKKMLELGPNSKLTESAVEYLQAWGSYTGNRKSLLKEAILLPKERSTDEKIQSATYLASTLEIHVRNLKELRDYMKATINSPESLAETYLQHDRARADRNKKAQPTGEWVMQMEEGIENALLEADGIEEEMEAMIHLFDKKIDEAKKSDDELAKEEFLHPRFHRAFDSMITQKERQVQNLHLQANRMRNLVGEILKKEDEEGKNQGVESVSKPEEEESIENSLARALDIALSAKKQKIVLPKKIEAEPEVSAGEILDASLVREKIQLVERIIIKTGEKLREVNPKAQDTLDNLPSGGAGLEESCLRLKEILFESVKNCEMLTAQSRGRESDINPIIAKLKSKLVSENPKLEKQQREWRSSLDTSLKNVSGAYQELEISSKPSKSKKNEKAEKAEEELKQTVAME